MNSSKSLYYRREGSEEEQNLLRDRLHWICEEAEGETVIEIGCDDGLLSHLLTEEEFSAVRLTEASQLEIKEGNSPENKQLETGEKQQVDTIVFNENLQNYIKPDLLMKNALKNLKQDGKVIISLPLGRTTDTSQKKIYFFTDVLTLLERFQLFIYKVKLFGNTVVLKTGYSKELSLRDEMIFQKVEEYYKGLIYDDKPFSLENSNLSDKKNELVQQQTSVQLGDKNKYEELKRERNKLLNNYEASKNHIKKLEIHLKKVQETVRYRIGDDVVTSFTKPSLSTFGLPFRVAKLLFEGINNTKRRIKRRMNRSNNHVTRPSGNTSSPGKPKREKIIERIKSFPEPEVRLRKTYNNITVACLMDAFSYECFRHEGNLVQLRKNTWQEQMDELKPDFLFVESAWHGVDKTWMFMLTDLHKKQDSAFHKLIKYCKEHNIPTVFWNKEDPPNYDHFIATAKMFDHVFTTEQNVIPKYLEDLDHDRIYALPFAAQPAIHNPINTSYFNKENIAFAGSWYAKKHEERQIDMDLILSAGLGQGLHIYDRFYNFKDNDRYLFPEKFQSSIVGSLEYDDMVKAYKMYKVFLNINSVKDSPTMFSRRVFELLACGTNVLSTYSKGIKELFEDIVFLCENEEEARVQLRILLNNKEISERNGLKGIREVYSKHLYRHRFEFILDKIGLDVKKVEEGVSVVTCTNRPDFMKNIIENFTSQTVENKELVIVLNSDDIDLAEWTEFTAHTENVKILQKSPDVSLGECLNYGIENTSYNYIAKLDDDDYYAPNYLLDALHAFTFSGADIVGKKAFYTYLESIEAVAVRGGDQENKFTDFVHGGTLVFTREVFNAVRFEDRNRGEDTAFLKGAKANGFKIYSSNRFNFAYMRSANISHHTWTIDFNEFMKNCEVVAYTKDFKSHVTV